MSASAAAQKPHSPSVHSSTIYWRAKFLHVLLMLNTLYVLSKTSKNTPIHHIKNEIIEVYCGIQSIILCMEMQLIYLSIYLSIYVGW
jgi:hypothetical protein